MTTRSNITIVALLAAVASGLAPAQAPPLATLTIEYTNGVLYWTTSEMLPGSQQCQGRFP